MSLLNANNNYYCYMNFSRITMILLGIWPIKIESSTIKMKFYQFYFLASFFYYILFVISALIMAILTWSDNYLITASSMGIVIEYASNIYKVILFKSQVFKLLIKEIIVRENRIFNSDNEEFIKIYKNSAISNKKMVLFYTIMGTFAISTYFFIPLISNEIMPLGLINNTTGLKNHYFITFSWFPFDANKHYLCAYLIQFFGCLYGYSYIVHCGGFYLSILTFVSAQLKIVQEVFENFNFYALNFEKKLKISKQESQFILLKQLVKEHNEIIEFVAKINNAMKVYTLINFIVSSFQLSLVAYQILKLPPMQQLTVFCYFITLSTQLFLTYNAAHNITIQGENIAASIFKGNWNTYSEKTLKFLIMICIRAQKPLVLSIGPFGIVKVTSLFQIFKALYSYMCIMLKD